MSLTAPEQPAPVGQDQQVVPEAAAPPAPAAPPVALSAPAGSAPWANDLNAIFTDEATRGQVDQFLREKVQPYTTQLEQKSAQATDATRLWNDLNAQPVDTYVAITEELFGPEVAQQLLAQVQTQLEQNQQPAPPGEAPQTPTPDPRLEAVLQYVENQQSNQYYDSQLQTITADPQYTDVDTALLHPFVAAADGDFARGIEMYREAALGFHAKYAPATAPPPTPEAPNVIASDTATGSTPPVVPQKESLGEAIEAVAREWRTAPAPPVGTA